MQRVHHSNINSEMGDQCEVIILPTRTHRDLDDVKRLFTAYGAWLNIDLSFQSFARELDTLPGKYAPPRGEILVARDRDDRAIGCVGLRPLGADGRVCEMKRLYIVPEGRKHGLGLRLVNSILDTAKQTGYCEMRLDTLSSMTQAISLYEKCGFVRIDAYYDTPLQDTIFLAKKIS